MIYGNHYVTYFVIIFQNILYNDAIFRKIEYLLGPIQGTQRRIILVVIFYILKLLFFCFVLAMCDLVHNAEAIFHLHLLTASGNLF